MRPPETVLQGGVCYFNPRTPCGVRLYLHRPLAHVLIISIHAPRAGCDVPNQVVPRLPAGFQSTHPVRGATFFKTKVHTHKSISIHAPRAGCDVPNQVVPRLPAGFQSTHPVRGATIDVVTGLTWLEFQSTHPVRGATSIVAVSPAELVFQSTHPVRGATPNRIICFAVYKISIHAPRAGCDPHSPASRSVSCRFQSTHPVRGATKLRGIYSRAHVISIHAPRAGCDRCARSSS